MRRAILREYRQQQASQRTEEHRDDEWQARIIGYLWIGPVSIADPRPRHATLISTLEQAIRYVESIAQHRIFLMSPIKSRYISNKTKIYHGVFIESDGAVASATLHHSDLRGACKPISAHWNGVNAKLYYWHWPHWKVPANDAATALLNLPDAVISGRVFVASQIEHWHQFRVDGDIDYAREMIAHLGMVENRQVAFTRSGRRTIPHYIYVKSDADAFAVRLAI